MFAAIDRSSLVCYDSFMTQTNIGFDGRKFLTDAEHQTYLRRMPVRYVNNKLKGVDVCYVCGDIAQENNPLQVAHKVPFGVGIIKYRLTPEWLDSEHNLVKAHRKICNKLAELTEEDISALVHPTSN